MKRLFSISLLLLICLLQGAEFSTLPDIVGSGATVQVTATHFKGILVQLSCPTGNAAAVRWGGPSTAVDQGAAIAPGYGEFLPAKGSAYDLSEIYVYVANGDKVTITWVNY